MVDAGMRARAARLMLGLILPLRQRVRHATYGTGTIVAVEGDEPERKFTVRFSDHGTKKLVEQYANLSWA